jgi:hypothetical protein
MARTLVANRAGYLPAPVRPIRAIVRVPLSNPVAALRTIWLIAAPRHLLFAPADRRQCRRSGSVSESEGERAEAAARAARRAALKPYRKFSHAGQAPGVRLRLIVDRVLSRLMLYSAPLDA